MLAAAAALTARRAGAAAIGSGPELEVAPLDDPAAAIRAGFTPFERDVLGTRVVGPRCETPQSATYAVEAQSSIGFCVARRRVPSVAWPPAWKTSGPGGQE